MTTVWVVGQVKDRATGDWELGGVFTTQERAEAACQHPDDCVWTTTLDQQHGRDMIYPPDCYYPSRRPT